MIKSKLHVTKKNQDIINLYNQDCKIVENLRPSSIRNNTVFLRTLADFLDMKTFNDCTEEDMKRFFGTTNYKDDSQEPLKVTIRKFYRWLYKTEEYPPVVKWIKLKTMKQRLEAREIDSIKKKIVSVEEYQSMISRISHDMQNQAIFETLYWSGC
jgi:site-specific recombinase XerD